MTSRLTAPAKINLALHVTGQRADGYHLLDSLVCFANLGDVLHIEPAADLLLTVTGPEGKALAAEDPQTNLVMKAAKALGSDKGAAITLEKRLPLASGIGGGSADAAAALKGLSALWDVAIPADAALALGADVPVCLQGEVARMEGIGEKITPLPGLPPLYAVLVNPRFEVSTPEIFKALQARNNPPLPAIPAFKDAYHLGEWLAEQRNDLEEAAVELHPEIDEVLEMIAESEGCLLARMSGSGATCFGLFATEADADEAASVMRMIRFDWWVKSARLGSAAEVQGF